ncbi:TatD-related deoxyribonuclease [Ignisphaera aggregans DSM 17230]|uniref:TatD-related deoxyribonuclease n=1 Tax=Ignisphaera aggregans (strain DSM 17230 / JCM 13409 / AQ1.S1) TaxID=583356 RepID=E0STT9_IGNAA|nr:TatD-related deoxyribonuclease [Ignisphaera aggregans DSM 17230]
MVLDAHCHLHEYSEESIENDIASLGIYVLAVSDDYKSSLRTLDLSRRFPWVIPAVGLHPWNVGDSSLQEARNIIDVIEARDVMVLGEIGLDKKFRYETFDKQIEILKMFLSIARDRNLVVNIHAAGAWREALELLYRYDISLAIIHWYTGPIELLKEIADRGYRITINPAISIQEKHREIVRAAPLEVMLLESDAPYRYRGIDMHPKMVLELYRVIASIKSIDIDSVIDVISRTSEEFLRKVKRF